MILIGVLQITMVVEVNNTLSCSDMDFMHTQQAGALCGTYKTCKMETSGKFVNQSECT